VKGALAEGLQQRRSRKGIGRYFNGLQASRNLQLIFKIMKFLSKAKTLYHWVIVNGFLIYKILVNPKTPWYVRLLLFIPLAYVFIPTDFIADAIPILGQLDDLAVLGYSYLNPKTYCLKIKLRHFLILFEELDLARYPQVRE
jgi:uncharacterized membrane protein YkvA (DUF1232 family)